MPKGPSQQPTMASQPTTVQNAGRLKYADPRDLPSYPSTGLRPDGAAAGAAASLGWQNKKTIETWRPDKSTASGTAATLGWNNTKTVEPWKPNSTSSASAAAALAKNYKMAPSWEPTATSASSRAALLAAGSAGSSNKAAVPRPTHDNWGSSAATQAFNADRSNSMRSGQYTTTAVSNQGPKSLAAAKGAMSGTRPRSTSTPAIPPAKESYPGESLAASNALSGATLAHRASTKPKPLADNAGAVPITTMTRNMFTSHPPVKLEVDEQQNNEKLHATAVAMARKMYLQQQKMADEAKAGQGQPTDEAKPYINLQDAAYKQAQERLAKLYEEHEKNRSMQEYYGNSPAPRRRFSLTSKLRRRASSDGDLEDRQQSEKIRREMSMFSDKLSQVDEKKRQKDRDAVLAAAQRNVKAQLQGMDQKVYNETGRVNPTLSSSWEARAQQIAEVNHETRSHNKGKIDIGGGKFMDPREVNAIAAKRVQPVLEDINTKAENERERLAVIRLEEEAKQAELERHKVRDREVKEIHQKLKEQEKQDEKARRQQEKEEEKAKKEEEKAIKAEQKRLAKEEKKKKAKTEPVVPTTSEHDGNDNDSIMSEESGTQEPVDISRTTAINTSHTTAAHTDNDEHKSPEIGTSPTSKVKGWIKNRFSRGKSVGEHEKPTDKGKGFVGGAALKDTEVNRSTTSLNNRPSSMRDVALAGKGAEPETQERTSVRDSRGVSPVSSEENLRVAKAQIQEDLPALTPPKPIKDPVARTSSSPTRDSRFRENLDQ